MTDVKATKARAAEYADAQKRSAEDARVTRFLQFRQQGLLPGVAFARVDAEFSDVVEPFKPLSPPALDEWLKLWARRNVTEAQVLAALGRRARDDVEFSDSARMTRWLADIKAGKAVGEIFGPAE